MLRRLPCKGFQLARPFGHSPWPVRPAVLRGRSTPTPRQSRATPRSPKRLVARALREHACHHPARQSHILAAIQHSHLRGWQRWEERQPTACIAWRESCRTLTRASSAGVHGRAGLPGAMLTPKQAADTAVDRFCGHQSASLPRQHAKRRARKSHAQPPTKPSVDA